MKGAGTPNRAGESGLVPGRSPLRRRSSSLSSSRTLNVFDAFGQRTVKNLRSLPGCGGWTQRCRRFTSERFPAPLMAPHPSRPGPAPADLSSAPDPADSRPTLFRPPQTCRTGPAGRRRPHRISSFTLSQPDPKCFSLRECFGSAEGRPIQLCAGPSWIPTKP